MTSTTGSSGQEVLQACTGEFRVYRGTRRGPSTPDSMSQTYLPVVGRKIEPQSAGPYAADVNSSSFKKTGRAAHRIRRKHRLQLRPLRNCMMATVNTQGLNWMRIAHQDKFETLSDLRRRFCWDVTGLTEIRATGFVLGHAARQAWEKAGRKVRVLHDRILGIPLQSRGGLSWIYSIYAPTGVTAAQYNEFLNIIEININTNHDDRSEVFYLIGDWNAHIGRNSKPDKVIIGPHTMRQCTSPRGKTLEKWLRSQQLTKTATTLSVMNLRMVWQSVARKANTTTPMMTTRGPRLQWQRITQPRTVRSKISPPPNSSPYVVKVRKRFWAGAHHLFLDHLSLRRTATRLRTTNAASRRCGQIFIENKELVEKYPSEQNTTASTGSSANSNTKQSKHTFDRSAWNWKGPWRLTTWENFYKLLPKLGVQLEGFSRRGLEPHSLQQITTYLTELGSNPPIVTDATIEQGLPQLPCDCTLDTAPHDAEILHELNRMKHSAPGEDEVTSSMYKSLSPLVKRVLCQRLRDLWTSPTHTWSSSLHSTLGFRLHKKGCRHDIGN